MESARTINRIKFSIHLVDITAIQTQFMSAVKEVKREIENDLSAAHKITSLPLLKLNTLYKLSKSASVQGLSTAERVEQKLCNY